MAVTVERLEAEIKADPSAAIAGLTALEAVIGVAARDRKATIDVDVDTDPLDRLSAGLRDVERDTDRGRQGLSGFTDQIRDTGRAAGGAGGGIQVFSRGLGGMGMSAGIGARGVAGLALGLGGLGTQIILVLGLIPHFIALLNVAIGAVVGLAGALAPLLGLLATLPAMLIGATGGLGALIVGMGGVGEAIKAGQSAQTALTGSRRSGASAARDLRAAERGLEQAQRSVTRAQEELKRAQEGVGEAREQAARRIRDLAHEAEEAVWNEEEAVIALQRAQENLNRIQNRTARSGMTLTQQTDEFTGKVYEVAYASEEAVDGQESLKDAQRDVVRAERELVRAKERTKDSQEESNEAALKGVEGSDLVRDAMRRQQDAARSLEDAIYNLGYAQERLAERTAGTAGAASAASNKFKEAMNDLTPAGRSFVTFMLNEFIPAWGKVKKAAQQALFPPIEEGMRGILAYLPRLEVHAAAFATTVGEAIRDFMGLFTGENAARTDTLFEGANRDLNTMLDVANLVGDAILEVARVAEESGFAKWFTDAVAGFLSTMAEDVIAMAEDGRLADWLSHVKDQAKLVWDFFVSVVTVLGQVTEAGKPLGNQILRDLTAINDKWSAWMNTKEGQKTMEGWFNSIQDILEVTWPLIEDIVEEFFKFGEEGSPVMEDFKTVIQNVHDALPEITRLIRNLSPIIAALSGVLKPALQFINSIIEGLRNPLVQRVLAMFGLGVVPNVAYQGVATVADVARATSKNQRRTTTTKKAYTYTGSHGYTFGGKATGGWVRKGTPYVVGERRPEVFVPPVSGRIQPRATVENLSGGTNFTPAQLEAMVERIAQKMKPDVSIENTFNEKVDPRLLSSELAWRLGQ